VQFLVVEHDYYSAGTGVSDLVDQVQNDPHWKVEREAPVFVARRLPPASRANQP
jgi:hypothetical protein